MKRNVETESKQNGAELPWMNRTFKDSKEHQAGLRRPDCMVAFPLTWQVTLGEQDTWVLWTSTCSPPKRVELNGQWAVTACRQLWYLAVPREIWLWTWPGAAPCSSPESARHPLHPSYLLTSCHWAQGPPGVRMPTGQPKPLATLGGTVLLTPIQSVCLSHTKPCLSHWRGGWKPLYLQQSWGNKYSRSNIAHYFWGLWNESPG